MSNNTLLLTTAALAGVGFVMYNAGYIGNPFEKFDTLSQQEINQIGLEGKASFMYDDFVKIQNRNDLQMFVAKWKETLDEWGATKTEDLLPTFFRVWMGRHPTLAADVKDRLTYLNLDSKYEDHTEDVFHDSREQVAERRKRNEGLIWRMYAPELFRPLELA